MQFKRNLSFCKKWASKLKVFSFLIKTLLQQVCSFRIPTTQLFMSTLKSYEDMYHSPAHVTVITGRYPGSCPEEYCSSFPVMVRDWVRVRVSFRVWGQFYLEVIVLEPYRKHPNNDNKICQLPSSSCSEQHFHNWFYVLIYVQFKIEWILILFNFNCIRDLTNRLRLFFILVTEYASFSCQAETIKLDLIWNFSKYYFNSFRTAKAASNGNHRPCLKSEPQVECHWSLPAG